MHTGKAISVELLERKNNIHTRVRGKEHRREK